MREQFRTANGPSYKWTLDTCDYKQIVMRIDECSSVVSFYVDRGFAVLSFEKMMTLELYVREAIRILQKERKWKEGEAENEIRVIINMTKMTGRIEITHPKTYQPYMGYFSLTTLREALKILSKAVFSLKIGKKVISKI